MPRTALIIGGGPAGLTAAWRLATQGYAITLIERSERLGGRLLRSSGADANQCDAIPPVFMGHQTATLALLKELGTADPTALSRDLRLEFLLPGGRLACLMQPWLPAPFHTITGLLLFGGLPLGDRWRVLDVIERSWEGDPRPAAESRSTDRGRMAGRKEAIGTGTGRCLDAACPFSDWR